jgi:plasmid stability protein
MTTRTITLNLPETLYSQFKARAQQTQRTVEDEVLDVLAGSVPLTEELPADLEAALTPLALLDDVSLWQAARSTFSPDAAQELEELHLKRQSEGLTDSETQRAATLVRQYERAMLVRAQAAALLKQRGHDISSLLAKL